MALTRNLSVTRHNYKYSNVVEDEYQNTHSSSRYYLGYISRTESFKDILKRFQNYV